MGKEKLKIQVKDTSSGQILFETDLENSEKAYAEAAQMEELGLDVTVHHPSLTDTLSDSLGLSEEAIGTYKESLDAEIQEHESAELAGSCCFIDPKNRPIH